MGNRSDSVLKRWLHRRALARLTRAANAAATATVDELRIERGRARQIRREADRLLHIADSRLMLPLLGSNAMSKAAGTDWAWRPDVWRAPIHPAGLAGAASKTALGDDVSIFHDCRDSELTLRQVRNTGAGDLAPFGLRLDILGFDGTFLSLIVHLPEAAVAGLGTRHVLRLESDLAVERPIKTHARLNVKHGPNTEQIVRELNPGDGPTVSEFDLGASKLQENRVERAWLDLIFDVPQMNMIRLADVVLSRRVRAEL